MNESEFERRVTQSARPHLKESGALDEAIRLVKRENKSLYNSHVSEAIMLANRLYERSAPLTHAGGKDDEQHTPAFSLAPTPTDYLAGELLVEKLAPWAEALREDGFGRGDAPFGTVAEAAAWIKKVSEANLHRWEEKSAERKAALEKIRELQAEHGIELEFKATLLPYRKPGDDHVKNVYTVPRAYLHKLALQTKRVAKHTGLAQDALVVHVLTGLRPAAPRMRVSDPQYMLSLPDGEQVFARWATVTFFARDLTYEEHKRAYNTVREHVGGKGTEGIGYRDLTFWWLMQEMGAPPREDKTRFWEEGLRRWKQLYPDAKPNGWQGVRKKYFDLRTRLERWGML